MQVYRPAKFVHEIPLVVASLVKQPLPYLVLQPSNITHNSKCTQRYHCQQFKISTEVHALIYRQIKTSII